MVVCRVKFVRGSGLGTRLFPWARCVLFSKFNKVPMLRPNWVQPRVGPILRGGIDLHSYHRQILLLGLFAKPAHSLSSMKDIWARLSFHNMNEQLNPFSMPIGMKKNENLIVNFNGDNGRFKYLNGYDEILRDELMSITRPKWIKFVNQFKDIPIGINVRMGNDFRVAKNINDHFQFEATKTPIKWFIESLILIREKLGFNAPAFIVSDGAEVDLRGLLSLPNTYFIRPGCAISDLLILSKSKILIRSGGSTFTAWASFLGQMPTISHPGHTLEGSNMLNKHGYYIGDFMPEMPNINFINDILSLKI